MNKTKSFTLVELIIVVIIVGILASLGLTQYNLVVEKARLAEARIRIGVMRQLAYEYHWEKGVFSGITNADVGATNTCSSTDYFKYRVYYGTETDTWVGAYRCTSGGKEPNVSREYLLYFRPIPSVSSEYWQCQYTDTHTSCFGYPP
jgi:prepilin-type N-terminal cleavage/methylation domain-containing protein